MSNPTADIRPKYLIEIQEEFLKEYPNPNDRASLDSWSSVYVHWLEAELIKARHLNQRN